MVKPRHDFAVGDLVLVADERVHRGQWPLGRLLEVHPERDGFISQGCHKVVYIDKANFKIVLPRTREFTSKEEFYLIFIAIV